MIKSKLEYERAKQEVEKYNARMQSEVQECRKLNLSDDEVNRLIAPSRAYYDQISTEIDSYEKLLNHDERELKRLSEFETPGRFLIALRLFRGVSQKQLAQMLRVDPSQVSRDEKNEYHGASYERLKSVFETLGFRFGYSASPIRDAVA